MNEQPVLIRRIAAARTQEGKACAHLFANSAQRYPELVLFELGELLAVGIDPTTLTAEPQPCRFVAVYKVSDKLNAKGNPYRDVIRLEPAPGTNGSANGADLTDLANELHALTILVTQLTADVAQIHDIIARSAPLDPLAQHIAATLTAPHPATNDAPAQIQNANATAATEPTPELIDAVAQVAMININDPTPFTSKLHALQWSVTLGAYPDIQAARLYYDHLKEMYTPPDAETMALLWRKETARLLATS